MQNFPYNTVLTLFLRDISYYKTIIAAAGAPVNHLPGFRKGRCFVKISGRKE